nr:hypothetical protein [Sphingomonas sp. CDS-1]
MQDIAWRVSAPDIEGLVVERLRAMLTSTADQRITSGSLDGDAIGRLNNRMADISARLEAVSIAEQREVVLQLARRIDVLGDTLRIEADLQTIDAVLPDLVVHECPIGFVRSTNQVKLIIPPTSTAIASNRNPSLLKLVAQAFIARREMEQGGSADEVAARLGYGREYLADMIRTSYLSPNIISAIINGTQPANLTRRQLVRTDRIPLNWSAQEQLFGFV